MQIYFRQVETICFNLQKINLRSVRGVLYSLTLLRGNRFNPPISNLSTLIPYKKSEMKSPVRSRKKAHSNNGKGNRSAEKRRVRSSRIKGEVTRHTYYARLDLLEKVQGYAYWERYGISELINQILEEFFEDKEVKPKPCGKRSRY